MCKQFVSSRYHFKIALLPVFLIGFCVLSFHHVSICPHSLVVSTPGAMYRESAASAPNSPYTPLHRPTSTSSSYDGRDGYSEYSGEHTPRSAGIYYRSKNASRGRAADDSGAQGYADDGNSRHASSPTACAALKPPTCITVLIMSCANVCDLIHSSVAGAI